MTTYIHDGIEVTKTGRTATKKRKARRKDTESEHTVVEIKSVEVKMNYIKWIDPEELFEVKE